MSPSASLASPDLTAAPEGRAAAPGGGARVLAALALLLVAARGLLVASLADVFLFGEELQKGAAGKALLDGLDLPWHALPFHPYEGGGFVVSHLDALAFAAVGQSLLALKLVALGFDLAILALGWRFARWAFGQRAAVVFGLLHVLAPRSVQQHALLALGIHYQALPFVLLVLHGTARVALEDDRRPRTFAALGLAAGFGTYFSYQVAVTVAYAGAVLLIARPRSLLARASAWGWAGFAAGIAPFLWMAAHAGSAVVDIHGQALTGGADARLGERLAGFLRSVYVDPPAGAKLGPLLRPLAVAAGAAAALAAARDARGRRCALLVLGALGAFLAAYLASGFAVGEVYHHFLFHRLSQAWLLGLLLIAAGAGAALEARRRPLRVGAWVAVALLALLGLRDTLALVAEGSPASWRRNLALVAQRKGYGYLGYLSKVSRELPGSREASLALLDAWREPDPVLLQRAAAMVLLDDPDLDLEGLRAAIASTGAADPRGFWLGLGPWLQLRYGGTLAERVRAVGDLPEGELLAEAVGRFGSTFPPTLEDLEAELRHGLEHELPPAYFRGLGARLYDVRGLRRGAPRWAGQGRPFAVDPDACERFLARLPPRIGAAMAAGYAAAVDEHSLP